MVSKSILCAVLLMTSNSEELPLETDPVAHETPLIIKLSSFILKYFNRDIPKTVYTILGDNNK